MKYWLAGLSTPTRGPTGRISFAPPTVLALLFLGLIAIGTLLLKLPAAGSLSWLQAAFTATSAVTITGLSVLDPGADLTRTGQIILLLLVQLGGLGIITFAVLVLSLLGQRIGLRQQLLLREDLNQTSLGDLVRLVRLIAIVVLIVEAVGTVLLAFRFVPDLGWSEGLFYALFHAVSAFNNAGFALYPDSLTRFATDPVINLVVPALIIIGGLGFSVYADLRQWPRRPLGVHNKLTLVGTAALLAWAFAVFIAVEWDNPRTLGQYDAWSERAMVAWFQAVTPRSGGLNTVDITALEDATTVTFIALMFIGGGSTSTAGGLKVTSFMVLVLATAGFLRGRQEPHAFGRSIDPQDLLKVLALTFISLLLLMGGLFLLTMTHRLPFLDLAFEATSAISTTGLSRNTTGQLNAFGQLLIMAMMFTGRLGPLALGFVLATASTGLVRYPRGRIYIG